MPSFVKNAKRKPHFNAKYLLSKSDIFRTLAPTSTAEKHAAEKLAKNKPGQTVKNPLEKLVSITTYIKTSKSPSMENFRIAL